MGGATLKHNSKIYPSFLSHYYPRLTNHTMAATDAMSILSPLTYGRYRQIKSVWKGLYNRYTILGKSSSDKFGFNDYIEKNWTTEQLMDESLDFAPSMLAYILTNWDVHRFRALLRRSFINHYGFMPKLRGPFDNALHHYRVCDKRGQWYGHGYEHESLSRADKMRLFVTEFGRGLCQSPLSPEEPTYGVEVTYDAPGENVRKDGKLTVPAVQQKGDMFSFKISTVKQDGTVETKNYIDVRKDLSKNTVPILRKLARAIGLKEYSYLIKSTLVEKIYRSLVFA
jgi:hypothetical protein